MKVSSKKITSVICSIFICGLLFFESSAAYGVITIEGQKTGVPGTLKHLCGTPTSHYCVDTLSPNPIEHLSGPSSNAITAMGRDFSDWTVTYNWTQPWNGTLNINTYETVDYSDGIPTHEGCIPKKYTLPDGSTTNIGGMGAHLDATYSPHVNNPEDPESPPSDDIERFRWVQMIITSDPISGATSPYVDPWGYEDKLPFYWKEGEHNDYNFRDWPRRDCPCLGYKWWRAELYLTDWYTVPNTEDKYLIMYDGIRWGFDINCVPDPASLGLAVIGLGTMLVFRAGIKINSLSISG